MFQQYIHQYNEEIIDTLNHLDSKEFEKLINILREAYKADKQVFIAGNGGSAGTANHFVCDFGKNAVQGTGKRRFRIISLCDNIEKITAFGNDVAFEEIYSQQLINLMNNDDVLIIISASGNSPDLISACEYAKTKNAHIIGLTGFQGGRIKGFAEANIIAPLTSYEKIEDIHMVITHMIVYFFRNHPEYLAE